MRRWYWKPLTSRFCRNGREPVLAWLVLAQRARIVLLAVEGQIKAEVGRLVGVSVATVRSWRQRHLTGGLDALADLLRSGRPLVHNQEHFIAVTLEPLPAQLGVA